MQTPKSKARREGVICDLRYSPFTLVGEENFTEFVKFVKNEKNPSFFQEYFIKNMAIDNKVLKI
ncbi:MAG TPA: hypothetical protein DEF02_00290 [Clostridiales bacterium]|nr:hypothetical protein [Clostridiales bacterium]HBW05023.1 hypothetical protein [Clostridiales bacterium]